MPRGAPKCNTCGLHPRSKEHKERCGIKSKLPKVDKVAEATEAFIIGKTCVGCHTIFNHTPFPPFQAEDAKDGKYDVTRQLPNTSPNYPVCEGCLPSYWRVAAPRYGMEKQVAETYADCF